MGIMDKMSRTFGLSGEEEKEVETQEKEELTAPNFDDVEKCRPLFKHMRKIFDEIKITRKDFDFLSMGMSHDFKIAVEEGANIVRVGTAIFGERIYN